MREDLGSIPGWGSSPGEGNGNPLQYSCLENPHGQRSLAGRSPWHRKELDRTEQVTLSLSLLHSEASAMLWRQTTGNHHQQCTPSWNLQSGWGHSPTVVEVYGSEECYREGYVVLGRGCGN